MNSEPFSDIPYFSKRCMRSFRQLFEETSLELIGVSYHADPVVILGRLGVVLDLLRLSPKSRVELLKSYPLFKPYFVQSLTYLRTKTRNAKAYRCNYRC